MHSSRCYSITEELVLLRLRRFNADAFARASMIESVRVASTTTVGEVHTLIRLGIVAPHSDD